MSNKLFIIIKPDEKEILDIFSRSPLENKWWGVSKKYQNIWKQIKSGDIIYLGYKNSSKFLYEGVVKETVENEKLSASLWGNNVKYKLKKYLIHVYNVKLINKEFHKFLRINNLENKGEPGVYLIQIDKDKKIEKKIKKTITSKAKFLPGDLEEPPEKFKSTITRFIRDTKKTIQLKKMYEYTCQVCKLQIKIQNDTYYSEVHHIHPLKEGGDDSFSNMIVLCPNDHMFFDYGMLRIDIDGEWVIDKIGKKIEKIKFIGNHKIAKKNIQYQYEELLENDT